MATVQTALALSRDLVNQLSELAGEPTPDAQVAALQAQIAVLTAENVALAAKLAAAKTEADQVVAEAQDARAKLD